MFSGHVAAQTYFQISQFAHTLTRHTQRGKGKRGKEVLQENIFVFVR